jgi:type II secretory pathway pseudopilin PulG
VKRERLHRDDGFLMAALLVAMTVMLIVMAAALPAWQTASRREKEAELIFRGKQYARAISAFSRKYGGAYPPTVDVLINEHFLRKKYKDPITGEDFVFITPTSQLATTSTGPLGVGASTRPGGTGGSSTPQSSGRQTGGSLSTSSSVSMNTTLSSAARSTQTGGAGTAGSTAGATAGIMGVQSKSKDKSLRVYNGYDHYNEWLFVGTLATQTAGSPTGGRAGTGTRGGAAGTRGGQPTGVGGRGAPPPAQPFGGQAPGGQRGVGPGGLGGAPGVPGRGR